MQGCMDGRSTKVTIMLKLTNMYEKISTAVVVDTPRIFPAKSTGAGVIER
jgi:hypothetical protein